jgi:hypothetical protein
MLTNNILLMKQRNFYEKLDAKYQGSRLTYATQKAINIELPFRMIVVGASGAKKTNTLLNIIDHMNCFHYFYVFCRNINQPLYYWLLDRLELAARNSGLGDKDLYMVSDTIDDLPQLETIDKSINNLIIIDDFVGDSPKNLKKIENFFIRSRTFNTNVIFITQSYFNTPKPIRGSTDYIIFKRTNDLNDFILIVKTYFRGQEKKILEFYKKVMAKGEGENFILFDLKTTNPKLRIRMNYG